MKNLSLLTCLMAILALAISCTAPQAPTVDVESVKSEIATMEEAYATAANAKDVEGILAYFHDDAQRMAPNKPTIKGMDAIKAELVKNMESDSTNTTISFAVTDVWAAGDMAVETGAWTVIGEDGTELDKGKYMSLFEKRDGKYACIRDIWNSDMPKKETPIAEATTEEMDE